MQADELVFTTGATQLPKLASDWRYERTTAQRGARMEIGVYMSVYVVKRTVKHNVIDFEADRSACSCAYNRRILL